MATAKIQTQGFKKVVHKLMGDILDATSIIYTVYVCNQKLPHTVQYSNSTVQYCISAPTAMVSGAEFKIKRQICKLKKDVA